jgi:hypothetical protein
LFIFIYIGIKIPEGFIGSLTVKEIPGSMEHKKFETDQLREQLG